MPSLKDYELIKKIGQGAQGSVWKAIRISDNKTIALKMMRVYNDTSFETAKNEIDKLKELSQPCHNNVVCYYGYGYDKDGHNALIEMEYIEGEDLHDYSRKFREENNYDKLYKHLLLITKDLIKGLIHIHKQNIIHNDIKPGNIMIDTNMVPKIVDFGLSCSTHTECNLGSDSGKKSICCTGMTGTPEFSSPEMYSTETRYPESDIWSLGMSLYYASTGKYPYTYRSSKPGLREIYQTITDNDPKKLVTNNELLNTIVNKSLTRDPSKRITGSEINDLLKKYK